jgi:NADPH-dependent 7-cyano-7-deazaguanine reductase QueF-like protein
MFKYLKSSPELVETKSFDLLLEHFNTIYIISNYHDSLDHYEIKWMERFV